MTERFRFNRMELAGSLGDLGTLLPIAIAMILFNGLNPMGLFFSVGLFFILSGIYFGVTVPVQPMKVIGAYAIARSMTPDQILAATLLMGAILLVVGLTGAIDAIRKWTPDSVIRGVQLSTGTLLIASGVEFVIGTSRFQELQNAAEPYLALQTLGPVPIGIILGIAGGLITLLLIDSKKFPAGLFVVGGGLIAGLALGTGSGLGPGSFSFNLPPILPYGFPAQADFTFALLVLVLPQLPMTLGNAVLAYTDLSKQYFKEKSAKVTNRKVCVSMALANFFSFCAGGMPLCHGAGGLAAHYRFGARTAGSNLFIGIIFAGLAIVLGNRIIDFLKLLPMSVLGILLIFAGAQLALTIMDLKTRKDFFVVAMILGITLASNLAAGFLTGIVIAHVLRWEKLSV
ncbi:MAG: putative sulfate/molybdate transporter [Desulfobacteraceae bacterium]|nr:putative sulfate/molybdate transporter [Desulfobacteraceae bacterium]